MEFQPIDETMLAINKVFNFCLYNKSKISRVDKKKDSPIGGIEFSDRLMIHFSPLNYLIQQESINKLQEQIDKSTKYSYKLLYLKGEWSPRLKDTNENIFYIKSRPNNVLNSEKEYIQNLYNSNDVHCIDISKLKFKKLRISLHFKRKLKNLYI